MNLRTEVGPVQMEDNKVVTNEMLKMMKEMEGNRTRLCDMMDTSMACL